MNSLTKKDSYPILYIDDTIDKIGGAKYFSAMDLLSRYWQVELPEEEQEKCVIIAQSGLYQPTHMPQGLMNAPVTFQRIMDAVMGDLKLLCVLVYLDDINVFLKTFIDHLEHLEDVFKNLHSAGLKLKPCKCQFFKSNIEFLGFVVSSEGIKPVLAKIEAIQKMKTPENLRDIQCFLGMLVYYRRFIPDFLTIVEPLINLLRGKVLFMWGEAQQCSFDTLYEALTSEPLLAYPDFDHEFIIQTDASLYVIGAVLSQISDDQQEHPIVYTSRMLNKHEHNYSVTEYECLVVIYAIKQFHVYIHGVHFMVITDHSSLKWLQTLKEPEGHLAHWVLSLQAFNFNIQHWPGYKHQNADCLSRLLTIAIVSHEADHLYELIPYQERWKEEPEEIQRILKKLTKGTFMCNEQLYHDVDGKKLPFIKPSNRNNLIVDTHQYLGHAGVRKTCDLLAKSYYWEGMLTNVYEFVQNCIECNQDKEPNKNMQY